MIIQFKVPQESIPDCTLVFEVNQILNLNDPITIEKVKKEIQEKHPLKPDIQRLKILYAGKILENNEKLSHILNDKLK